MKRIHPSFTITPSTVDASAFQGTGDLGDIIQFALNYDHSLYWNDIHKGNYVWFEVTGALPTSEVDISYGNTDEHTMGKFVEFVKQRNVTTGSETLTVTVTISGFDSTYPTQSATITITNAGAGTSFTREEGMTVDD